jgi:hypothetical protein
MIALIRPSSWDFPLFVHVLGAMALFGGTLFVATLGFTALRVETHAQMLRRLAFGAMFLAVWPAFIVMRVGAQWIYSKEDLNDPTWFVIGAAVGDGGILVLLALTALAWLAVRGAWARASTFFAWLAGAYLVALAVAWWAMSAKPS